MKRQLMILAATAVATSATLPARADELTVHDGTATSYKVPAYHFYFDDFTRAQTVYPADELAAVNGRIITSVKWYSDVASFTFCSPVVVYLKEVDNPTINAYTATDECIIVYQGTLSTGIDGAVVVAFSEPFAYNGGNLLIGVENVSDTGYKKINFYGETVVGASIAGNSSSPTSAASVEQQNFIPKTTFTHVSLHTVSGLPTTNATVTVDGVTVDVPASGEIKVPAGAKVKVIPVGSWKFTKFAAAKAPNSISIEVGESTMTFEFADGEKWSQLAARDERIYVDEEAYPAPVVRITGEENSFIQRKTSTDIFNVSPDDIIVPDGEYEYFNK